MSPKITTDHLSLPAVGFGVFQIPAEDTAQAVAEAIEVGYRHIDTAQSYANEAGVGEGIRQSGISRDELFITTKIWIDHYGREATRRSVERSLEAIGVDSVDLVLLHQPYCDVYGAWQDLQNCVKDGLIGGIGVSNFSAARLHDLGTFNEVYPAANQIEINPYHQQTQNVEKLQSMGVLVEAWAPFGEGRSGLFEDPVLSAIGQRHNKSVAQVVLRWLYQRGIATLAKSVHRERMEQNINIFDFELSTEEMKKIAGLDRGASLFFDHESTEAVDMMSGLIRERRN